VLAIRNPAHRPRLPHGLNSRGYQQKESHTKQPAEQNRASDGNRPPAVIVSILQPRADLR
jgi:hypothetical protein